MHEDSIQKASSVEVAEGRKGSLLRPIVIRGDSFFNERNANATLDNNSRLASSSLRPRLNSVSSARTPTSPAPKSPSYRPDWAQDAEDVRVQPLPVDEDELGSPEDLRDMLRMGTTQEMRVSLDLVGPRGMELICMARECFDKRNALGSSFYCRWLVNMMSLATTTKHSKPVGLGYFFGLVRVPSGPGDITLTKGFRCGIICWLHVRHSVVGRNVLNANISGFQNSPVNDPSGSCHISQAGQRMTIIGWQCGNASGIFLTGSLAQSIITIYRPANGWLMWQTIVFLLPFLAVVILTNIYGGRTIATLQNVMMSVHILALIAMVGKYYLWKRLSGQR
ncbi:hypothetical protein E4T49_04672 [Aureobasidium sp. EXF-10728]|nr:hypothetical protein E4T49_04672 [Aureobasidium sp. EXF-10728]